MAGEKRKGHKYIARVFVKRTANKNIYRYFYDISDYQKYLKDKKEGDNLTGKTDKSFGGFFTSSKNSISSIFDRLNKKLDKGVSNVKSSFDKFTSKYISKAKKLVKSATKKFAKTKLSDIKDDTIDSAKKYVNNFLKKSKAGAAKISDVMDKLTETEKDRKAAKQKAIKEAKALKTFGEAKKKSKKYSKKEDQEAVNPNYDEGDTVEYSSNCTYCTAAYDLRRRGYDVEAMPAKKGENITIDEIKDWYDGEKTVSFKDLHKKNTSIFKRNENVSTKDATKWLEESMKKEGDGARGHLALYWSQGGGHDVIWEVQGGEVVVRDCQSNKVVELYDYVQYAEDFSYFRTDNVKVNKKVLKTVKNRDRRDD